MKRPPSEHQVMDDEADHPGNNEDRAGGEELAFGLASCGAVQEKVEHECAEPDRYESDGYEVHAERRANDKADDCPRDRGESMYSSIAMKVCQYFS